MGTVDIKEVKQRIREFAKIVDEAHKNFTDSDCHNEEGSRIFVGIFNNEELDNWIERNNQMKERKKLSKKDFIPIRNGMEYVGAFDFFANTVSLRQDQ